MTCNHILIADDSSVQRRVLATALTGEGYTISSVKDGFEAMHWIEHNPPPDLIITDFHMPDMDGAGLIQEIRAKRGYRQQPIFVLTSGGDARDKEAVRKAGATAWILKPFDISKLVAAIKKVTS